MFQYQNRQNLIAVKMHRRKMRVEMMSLVAIVAIVAIIDIGYCVQVSVDLFTTIDIIIALSLDLIILTAIKFCRF